MLSSSFFRTICASLLLSPIFFHTTWVHAQDIPPAVKPPPMSETLGTPEAVAFVHEGFIAKKANQDHGVFPIVEAILLKPQSTVPLASREVALERLKQFKHLSVRQFRIIRKIQFLDDIGPNERATSERNFKTAKYVRVFFTIQLNFRAKERERKNVLDDVANAFNSAVDQGTYEAEGVFVVLNQASPSYVEYSGLGEPHHNGTTEKLGQSLGYQSLDPATAKTLMSVTAEYFMENPQHQKNLNQYLKENFPEFRSKPE